MLKNLLKYLLILACCSFTNFASAQWQQITSGVTANLVDGCFVTDSIGYIISANGTVLKTTDAGNSWTQNASLSGIFTSICHVGTDTIYAGGSCIYRSDNGGASWNLITSLNYIITDMIFFSGQKGYTIVPSYYLCQWSGGTADIEYFYVYKSVNNGATWQADFSTHENTSRFQLINDSTAIVSGGYHDIAYHCSGIWQSESKITRDRGNTWTLTPQPYNGHSCFSYINDSVGYFVQPYNTYNIYKTTNIVQWLTSSYTEMDDISIRALKFINEIDGYLLGRNNLYVTSSNGFAWNTDYSTTDSLNYLFNSNANTLFAIGSNGLIIKKDIVPSAYPDTIYRVYVDNKSVDFSYVSVDSTVTKTVKVKNSGSLPMTISLASSNDFKISFTNASFQNNLTCSLNTFQDTTIYIQFNPLLNQAYAANLTITADSLIPMNIPINGIGYYGINGILSHDTLICVDTLNIGGNVTISNGTTVTICAGTYVKVLGKYKITVEGVLQALGDSLHNIDFVPIDTVKLWNGIDFKNVNINDTSKFDYCNFTSDCNNPFMFIYTGIVDVNHSVFSNKKINAGAILLYKISGQGKCIITIANSTIYDTKDAGISLNGCDSAVIKNCNIYNNIHGIEYSTGYRIAVEGSTIHNNLQEGIYGYGRATIVNNRIYENGGGINVSGIGFTIANNEVYNNYNYYVGGISCAVDSGGGYINQNVVFNNESMYGNGAGINIAPSGNNINLPVFVTNNTICNNKAGASAKGNNFYATSNTSSGLDIKLYNNIIYNNADSTNNIAWLQYVTHDIQYNCIKQDSINIWGQNNINYDPKFVKATDSVGVMSNIGSYDWSLTQSSRCINGGDSLNTSYLQAIDFASLPRIYNGRVDIGAYEFQGDYVEEIDTTSIDTTGTDTTTQVIDTLYSNTIYPNPSNNSITVQSHRSSLTEIILYDATKLIYRKEFSETTIININRFANGLYIYELRDSNGVIERGKLVKY